MRRFTLQIRASSSDDAYWKISTRPHVESFYIGGSPDRDLALVGNKLYVLAAKKHSVVHIGGSAARSPSALSSSHLQ
jgi:hypothetical protein